MADKWPVTSRDDVPFGDIPSVTKHGQESFDDPMNPLNKPVALRKGEEEPNGWQWVVGVVDPTNDEKV